MTKKQKAARIAALKELLEANGFGLKPRWGHYYKTRGMSDDKGRPKSKAWRAKFQQLSVRIEVQGTGGQWFNLASDYFTNIDPQVEGPVVRAIGRTNADQQIIWPEGAAPKKQGLTLGDLGLR